MAPNASVSASVELVTAPGLSHDEKLDMRSRAMREARALARLNNPNVVKSCGCGSSFQV